MAEIILPPEENEETPQVPELNIDKPTMNSKVITIEFEAKKTNKVSTKDTNQQLYTTDTDAWFEFKETSLEGANGTYSVVFRNRHDESIFQRTGDVVNGVAYYKIPHQEIRHAGAWRGQIVYTLENGNTTAREFGYDVKGHILDGKDVREIVVEDFETLMSQLRSMKDNAESELADLVNTANQNETDRQAFFNDLVEDIDELQANYQELLDTGVLQTNINTKLEQLEEEYAPKLTEVTAQLDKTSSQVGLVVVASDQDDTQQLINALNNSKKVTLEYGKNYFVSSPIVIPVDTVLDLNGSSINPTGSFDVLRLEDNAQVYNGVIDTRGVDSFYGNAVVLDGVDNFAFRHSTRVYNIALQGDGNTNQGSGLLLRTVNDGEFICWVNFDDVTINGFSKGLHIDCQNTGGQSPSFINGNIFNNFFISYCEYNIYIEADSVAGRPVNGNFFTNIEHQTGTMTKRIMYCEGSTNIFQMYLFDFYASSSETAYELTEESQDNTLNISAVSEELIIDRGKNNIIKTPMSIRNNNIIPPTNYEGRSFLGNQDDYLANASHRFDITTSHEPTGGAIRSMFTLDGGVGTYFPNTTKESPLVIEIDCSDEPMSGFETVGLNFLYNARPKNIKIEVFNGSTWKEKVNRTNNYKQSFYISNIETRVEKIRITMSESMSNDIRIARIYASSTYNYGRAYVNSSGGKIYGDLEFRYTKGIVMESPDGSSWRQTINNEGVAVWTKL